MSFMIVAVNIPMSMFTNYLTYQTYLTLTCTDQSFSWQLNRGEEKGLLDMDLFPRLHQSGAEDENS